MERHILVTLLLSVLIALLGIGIIVPVIPVFATVWAPAAWPWD